MLLGLSGLNHDAQVSFEAVVSSGEGDGGVPHGQLLSSLVEAMWTADPNLLATARDAATAAAGGDVVVDAIAVSANFHMMTRIADATGTAFEESYLEASKDIREQVGVNDFESRRAGIPAEHE